MAVGAIIGVLGGLLGGGASAFGSIKGSEQASGGQSAAAEALRPNNVGFNPQLDPLFGGFNFETQQQLGLPGAVGGIVTPVQNILNQLNTAPAFGHTDKNAFNSVGNLAGRHLLTGSVAATTFFDPDQTRRIAEEIGFTGLNERGEIPLDQLDNFQALVELKFKTIQQNPGVVGQDPLSRELIKNGVITEELLSVLDNTFVSKDVVQASYDLGNFRRVIDQQLGTIGETLDSVLEQQSSFEKNFDESLSAIGGREGLEQLARDTFVARRDAESGIASLTSDLAAFASGEGLRGGTNKFGNFLTDTINDVTDTQREDLLRQAGVAGLNPGRPLSDLEQQRQIALGGVPFAATNQGGKLLALLQTFLAPAQNNALAGSQFQAGTAISNSQLAAAQSQAQAQLLSDAALSQGQGTASAFNNLGQGILNAGAIAAGSSGPAGTGQTTTTITNPGVPLSQLNP